MCQLLKSSLCKSTWYTWFSRNPWLFIVTIVARDPHKGHRKKSSDQFSLLCLWLQKRWETFAGIFTLYFFVCENNFRLVNVLLFLLLGSLCVWCCNTHFGHNRLKCIPTFPLFLKIKYRRKKSYRSEIRLLSNYFGASQGFNINTRLSSWLTFLCEWFRSVEKGQQCCKLCVYFI